MTKAQGKKKATKKTPSPVLDNFDDYRQWIREATTHDREIGMSEIRRDWDTLPPDHTNAFADAVRAFREAKGAQVAAYTQLQDAANKASDLEDSTAEKRGTRKFGREAGTCRSALTNALRACNAANYEMSLQLDDLDDALASRPEAEIRATLHQHQRTLRQSVRRRDAQLTSWIKEGQLFMHDVDWTAENNIETFILFAQDILNNLPPTEPASAPANGSHASSPKRKRHDDDEEPDSKAMRRAGDASVARSGSVQAGAEQAQQQPLGALGNAGNHKATTRDEPLKRDLAAPGAQSLLAEGAVEGAAVPHQPSSEESEFESDSSSRASVGEIPGHATNDESRGHLVAAPEPPEDPVATLEPLPLPEAGTIGPYTTRLRDAQDRVAPSFKSWCRSQLTDANYSSLEDVEPLATAFKHFWDETLPDHDWENEGGVPYLPFTRHDFRRSWPEGRLWPNVRRLRSMLDGSPADLQSFCVRNLIIEGDYVAEADSRARDILVHIRDGGLAQDWDMVNDLDRIVPPPDHTDEIPLDGLNSDGQWNYHKIIGEGGNGRAVLYCKYNRAGNIVQRVISKESFIGQLWNLSDSWHGPVAHRIPIEAGLHALLPRHRHIIEYLGFNVNKQLRMVRIYTAFAALGDLNQLFRNHADMQGFVDEAGDPLEAPPIPTVAILYTFEAMAAGACLMAHGTVPDDQGRWPADRPLPWNHNIVHRDIKPQNYFLAASESTVVWPTLPIAALGDFGNAIDAAAPVYSTHPEYTRGMTTERYMAPEQQDDAPAEHPLTSATNVYQIGLAILQLMYLAYPQGQRTFNAGRRDEIFPDSATIYPQQLIDVAWSCIRTEPRDRPMARALYLQIRGMARGYSEDSTDQIPWQLQHIPADQRVRTQLDKWAS